MCVVLQALKRFSLCQEAALLLDCTPGSLVDSS